MIAVANNSVVVINNLTSRRASVIAHRTNSEAMGVIKAQIIDLLKAKLQMGVAHFVYMKKDGTLREAWGITASNLMNTVCYWDCEKGGFRSLRFENLIEVL